MLFGHGDDFYNFQEEVKINFSSNLWRGADLSLLIKHLESQFHKISMYPEPDAGSLKRLLARRFEVKESNVAVTNGSVAAFYLIAQTWSKSRSSIFIPSFSEYEAACRLHGHEITFVFNDNDISNMSFKGEDFCWIGNPNNPNGVVIHRSELLKVITENRNTTFVIDQSYASFTVEDILKPSDLKNNKNLILVHSMSGPYNIPGLRIGYVIASSTKIKEINKYILPWSVNALAIEASKYILIHPAQFTLPIRKWNRDTLDFIYQLNKLDGVEVQPTNTTFFLVRLKKGNSSDLKKHLMKNYGILIRDASNFKGLDDTFFRLCTQTNDKNMKLIEAIRLWLETID